jgi:glucan 1,3-beta-glucosidase
MPLIHNRPDTDATYNADLSAIQQSAPNYADQVYAVTVGSETLYRGNFTGPQLWSKMQAVKQALGGKFRVGTADSWNKYADGTADAVIQGGPDLLYVPHLSHPDIPWLIYLITHRLVNAFGFWQGSPIANASHQYFDDIMQAFSRIEKISGSNKIETWTGETGWPTGKTITSPHDPYINTANHISPLNS